MISGKVLHHLGHVKDPEPFQRLVHQVSFVNLVVLLFPLPCPLCPLSPIPLLCNAKLHMNIVYSFVFGEPPGTIRCVRYMIYVGEGRSGLCTLHLPSRC